MSTLLAWIEDVGNMVPGNSRFSTDGGTDGIISPLVAWAWDDWWQNGAGKQAVDYKILSSR
jgi:hypothetical protein